MPNRDSNGRFIKADLFTEEQKQFLIDNWNEEFTYDELVKLLNEEYDTNFKAHNVQKYLRNKCGLKKPKYKFRYTDEMMQWIRNAYEKGDMYCDEMVESFNSTFNTHITITALWSKASTMGIKKKYLLRAFTIEEISWIKENISKYETIASCFDAFKEYFNKDIDRVSFNNLLRRCHIHLGKNVTSFKKGIKPKNTHQDGYEVIRNKGTVTRPNYDVYVKKDGKWYAKRNLVWIEHYGKIPKGKIVIRLDDDINNYDISNLALIDSKIKSKLAINGNMKMGLLTKAYIEVYSHMDELEKISSIEEEV